MDTSFLVSLYVLDSNSQRAAARIKVARLPLLLTPLGELELVNAILQRLFRRELSRPQAKAALAMVTADIDGGILQQIPMSHTAFERAKRMARKHTPRLGTGTLDILHVASAVVAQADAFYTFDQRQAKLARAEGMTIA